MNNIQSILLFPVRDEYARKQFLLGSLVMLAGMIIPILPMLVFMGYSARIMRQIIDEDKEPSMLEWQGSDWGALLQEGLRIFGVRIVLSLPILLIMGCGFVFMFTSSFMMIPTSNSDPNPLAPLGGLSLVMGMGLFLLGTLISMAVGVIMGAAEAHAVAKQSFNAGLQVREWWPIFRAGLSQFLLAYVIMIAISFGLTFVMQIMMVTIILICILPFFTIGYSAYISLVMYALFAKAYVAGRKSIQTVENAPA